MNRYVVNGTTEVIASKVKYKRIWGSEKSIAIFTDDRKNEVARYVITIGVHNQGSIGNTPSRIPVLSTI